MSSIVPVVHNWLAGDSMNAVRMNEIKDQLQFLRNPPSAHVVRGSTSQTLSNTWNIITFDTLVNSYDPYGMWNAGSPTKLTAQVAGWYTVEASMNINGTNNEGRDILGVFKNSTATTEIQMRSDVQNAFLAGTQTVTWTKEFMLFLNAGDWIHLGIWFDSDVSRTTTSGDTTNRTGLRARWVSN